MPFNSFHSKLLHLSKCWSHSPYWLPDKLMDCDLVLENTQYKHKECAQTKDYQEVTDTAWKVWKGCDPEHPPSRAHSSVVTYSSWSGKVCCLDLLGLAHSGKSRDAGRLCILPGLAQHGQEQASSPRSWHRLTELSPQKETSHPLRWNSNVTFMKLPFNAYSSKSSVFLTSAAPNLHFTCVHNTFKTVYWLCFDLTSFTHCKLLEDYYDVLLTLCPRSSTMPCTQQVLS